MSDSSWCAGCFQALYPGQPCSWCAYNPPDVGYQDLPASTVLAGRFLIGRVLGRGGFGVTYLGWDQSAGERVAIKEYLPQTVALRDVDGTRVVPASSRHTSEYELGLKDFLEEGRRLAKFQHPNIVSVREYVSANGTGYLVMEYCVGYTLKDHVHGRGGRLPYGETLEIMLPVLGALETVHAENIYHRDVSPDNIMITGEGVKLIDFGAARAALSDRSVSFSTIVRQDYAPPEQYSRRGKQGPWSDVYATAATMYHVLTGQPPPPAPARIEQDHLPPPRMLGIHLPADAESALLQALSLNRDRRPQSAAAFRAALTGTNDARPADVHPAAWPWVAAAAAIVVVSLGAVGAAGYVFAQQTIPPKIVGFSATPSQVRPGQPVTLSWETTGAREVELSPYEGASTLPPTSSVTVTPRATTTYTLTARRGGQFSTDATVVRVDTPPAAPPPAAPRGPRGSIARRDEAKQGLDVMRRYVTGEGYRETFTEIVVELSHAATGNYTVNLETGNDYVFIAAGNASATDIDLAMQAPDGSAAVEDKRTDARPIVRLRPAAAGRYGLVVTMASCKDSPCTVALTGLSRRVPQ